jgi:hypothetical protein
MERPPREVPLLRQIRASGAELEKTSPVVAKV